MVVGVAAVERVVVAAFDIAAVVAAVLICLLHGKFLLRHANLKNQKDSQTQSLHRQQPQQHFERAKSQKQRFATR